MQEEDYKLIDRYLAGELNEAEKAAAEARMATDEPFAEEVQLRREMGQFLLQGPQREQLKGQFAALGKKYFTDEGAGERQAKVLGLSHRQWLFAAGFALIIVAGALLYTQLQGSLYEQYNIHPPLALTEKSSDGINLSQVEQAFNNGQYQEALEGLNAYLNTYPGDLTAQLFKGIAALELKQYSTATPIFESLRQSDTGLQDYATWYLALASLRQEDREQCRELLEEIPEGSELRERAEQLLGEL